MRKLECDDTYSVWRRFPDCYVDATAFTELYGGL